MPSSKPSLNPNWSLMSVVDLNTFNLLKESMGEDFMIELTDAFLEDAVNQMVKLQTALDANDVETFTRAAHSLKSNAATFGANEFSSLARELETMGRNQKLEVSNQLIVLKEAFEQVKLQLNQLKKSSG